MRQIDADELLINMAAGCIPIMKSGISGVTGDQTTIKDYIDRQPTVLQWIPVSERMPEDGEDVLVSTTENDIAIDFRDEDEWFWYDEADGRITAWMPLPKPY